MPASPLTSRPETERSRGSDRGLLAFGLLAFPGAGLSLAACFAEILISHKAFVELEDDVRAESAGVLEVKGFRAPVTAYRVTGLAEAI